MEKKNNRTRRVLLTGLAAAAALPLLGGIHDAHAAYGTVSDSGQASADIMKPLQINVTANMNFGKILITAATGKCVLDETAATVSCATHAAAAGGSPAVGKFTLKGSANVNVGYAATATTFKLKCTNTTGGDPCTANHRLTLKTFAFSPADSGTGPKITGTKLTVKVGSAIRWGATQPGAGKYTGSYTIKAFYE